MALTKRTYTDGETIITAQNLNDIQDEIISHGNTFVPKTRTVNGKALSGNISISASDIPNDSSVSGTTTKDALDTLSTGLTNLYISSPSDVGLTGTPSLAAFAAAMPNNSVAYVNASNLNLAGLSNASNVNLIQIVKLSPGRTWAIGMRTYVSVTDATSQFFFATYSNNDTTFYGFFEVARKTDVDNFKKNNLASVTVNLASGDYPESSPYVTQADGYVFLNNASGQNARMMIYGAENSNAYIQLGYAEGRYSMFVRAGMKIALAGTATTARFVELS